MSGSTRSLCIFVDFPKAFWLLVGEFINDKLLPGMNSCANSVYVYVMVWHPVQGLFPYSA